MGHAGDWAPLPSLMPSLATPAFDATITIDGKGEATLTVPDMTFPSPVALAPGLYMVGDDGETAGVEVEGEGEGEGGGEGAEEAPAPALALYAPKKNGRALYAYVHSNEAAEGVDATEEAEAADGEAAGEAGETGPTLSISMRSSQAGSEFDMTFAGGLQMPFGLPMCTFAGTVNNTDAHLNVSLDRWRPLPSILPLLNLPSLRGALTLAEGGAVKVSTRANHTPIC